MSGESPGVTVTVTGCHRAALLPFWTQVTLVIVEGVSQQLGLTHVTLGRHLRHGFLHGQVTHTVVLGDFTATVRARRPFISDASIGQ